MLPFALWTELARNLLANTECLRNATRCVSLFRADVAGIRCCQTFKPGGNGEIVDQTKTAAMTKKVGVQKFVSAVVLAVERCVCTNARRHSGTRKLLDDQATRKGVRQALEEIGKQAQPKDTLLVYLAGHGTMVGQRYFFIGHEFQRQQGKSLEDDVREQGLAADVLGDLLAGVPALKRMLIFDTCHSGGALGLVKTARNPFAFRGAVERLSRSQGVFTIAASAASEEAQEVPELGHGVLTYALLAGLGAVNQGPLVGQTATIQTHDNVVEVDSWFQFARAKVPALTKLYFNHEQFIRV